MDFYLEFLVGLVEMEMTIVFFLDFPSRVTWAKLKKMLDLLSH